jgi:glutathione peroxidase
MYLHRTHRLEAPTDIYTHNVKMLDGDTLNLSKLHGTPTLFVNTASKCGYTPQYEGLQKLFEEFAPRGLQLIGTPSGDFADQEFENASEIGAFCQKNYGVSFPLTERASVRQDPGPLWRDLGAQPNSGPPTWNFTKYLVGADGRLIARWASKVKPDDPRVRDAIEAALKS